MNKEQFIEQLASINSQEELDKLVGELTPEERKKVEEMKKLIGVPPTPEEDEALGQDFTERLIQNKKGQ